MIEIKLHPESRTSTIPAPKGAVGEVVAKRRASQKCWQMPDGKQVIYCWNKYAPVHYLDDYSEDTKQAWKEIDPTYYEDMGDHLLFNRMPHTVKIWKNKPGYEIVDRLTGKTMSAELLELDDEQWDKSSKAALVTFEAEVLNCGVRMWKESQPGGPTKFKWRVKESAGESRLNFREVPEAFDLTKLPAGLETASNEDKEKARVNIAVLKTPLADGFNWVEQVERTGIKIDTDIIGQTSDGYIYGKTFNNYATARNTSTNCYSDYTYIDVGQRKDGFDYYVKRGFLDFDTSGLSGTVSQVNLKLVCIFDYSNVDFDIQIIKHDWSESLCDNRETNFDGCLSGTEDDNIWRNTSGMSTNTAYSSGDLDTSHVNTSGDTKYSLRSSRDESATQPSGNEDIRLASADHGTSAYRPILVITVATGWTGKIWGVENPASIWGIDVANIAKVHGL